MYLPGSSTSTTSTTSTTTTTATTFTTSTTLSATPQLSQSSRAAPQGWDSVLDNLQKGAPTTEKGWPQVHPGQSEACLAAMQKEVLLDNGNYKQLIQANGKLLIGDYHNGLDGILTLYHLLQELPVKHLYLEGGDMGIVLKNPDFIQWLKDYPNASAEDAFHRMTQLCLQQAPPRMQEISNLVEDGGLTLSQAADILRRWLEVECAVAKHLATNNIPVSDIFAYKNPDEVHTTYSERVLVDEAYKSFVDDSKGLRVMLVGINHVVDTREHMPDESLYGLLASTKGLCARTTRSYAVEEEKRKLANPYRPVKEFFVNNEPLGAWKVDVQVPGAAAGESAQAAKAPATIAHQTMFSLYKAPG